MSCYANMPPPWMWGSGPQAPSTGPTMPNIADIQTWIRSLEDLKKSLKDEPKKDDNKDKKKEPQVPFLGVMAFMLLISPITGPTMYYFFQKSLGLIH